MTLPKLKPCPFCGQPVDWKGWKGNWQVECPNEKCFVKPFTRLFNATNKEAAEAWNQRMKERK